jgi:hypothetical protein
LEGKGSDVCYEAFDVIPREGYRTTDVKISVINPGLLDYDRGSCNDITFRVSLRCVHLPSVGGKETFSRIHSNLSVGFFVTINETNKTTEYLVSIRGSYGGDYEEWCLLGCYTVWLLQEPTFPWNLAPLPSG